MSQLDARLQTTILRYRLGHLWAASREHIPRPVAVGKAAPGISRLRTA